MDSVTHIVLGAAIGEALLGKKIGRKAALIGAFAKTFPDFDLLYTGLSDPRLYMCCHRGHTHSMFWELLYAFPLAYVFWFLFKKKISYKEWLLLFFICLFGHSLLDTCTNFGTRLFLPFTDTAYSWNNLAIVDLAFTAPMLIMLIIGLFYKNNSTMRSFSTKFVLGYCLMYLGFTFVNKSTANSIVEKSMKEQQIPHNISFTNPTILNNILWYGMAADDSTIHVGEFTLLHPSQPIQWHSYPRKTYLLDQHPDKKDAKLLNWFSQGYSICQQDGDTLNVYCVKFGRTNMKEDDLEKSFIFHYKLYQADGEWKMGMEEPNEGNSNMKEGFFDLMNRIQGKNNP